MKEKPRTRKHQLDLVKCPVCDDVVPSDLATTKALLDGKEVRICDSCAWHLENEAINE